jgi:AcrR family transcriptional regulator
MPKSPSSSKPRYHHGDLRHALLVAAGRILDKQGAGELSLRETAHSAGVSAAAPYRHFANKEALLAALAEDGFAELEQVLTAAAERHPGRPQAQLQELAVAYLRLAARRPHFFRMMFSVDLGPSRVDDGVVRACDRVAHGLARTLAEGLPSSARSGSKAEQAFLLYWSTLHGYAMLLNDHKLDDLELNLERHCAKLSELLLPLFKGLGIATRVSAGRSRS